MSGYERMISYLYRYDKGVKGSNAGYAKMELRGDRCRVSLQLRDTLSASPPILFFRQREEKTETIPAGRLKPVGNGFGIRIETERTGIMNTPYDFSEIDGIMIPVSRELFYATTWKQIVIQPPSPEIFRETSETEKSQPETEEPQTGAAGSQSETEEPQTGAAGSQPETEEQQTGAAGSQPETEEQQTGAAGSQPETEEQQTGAAGSQPETEEQQTGAAGSQSETEERQTETEELQSAAESPEEIEKSIQDSTDISASERIFEMFPKMYPFEIDNIRDCVRLDLKDMGYLPVRYWSLAGNPFLLQGYYSYRHLIFIRDNTGKCAMGVPGIYSNQNREKASRCGFVEFQTLAQVRERQGAFGYWLYYIL
jgi:hypothetical protein